MAQTLNLSQLDDVIDVLKKCGFSDTRWLRLGLKLGLLKTTLDAIEEKYRGDVDRCLMECLSKWLYKADNVVSRGGPPTWDSLSAALRAIDEIAVADNLDSEKRLAVVQAIAILSTHRASLSQSLSDPVSVARLLCGEDVITGAVLANVESTGQSLSEKRLILLAAVRDAVQINYQSLQTFGTVLCKVTGNVRLGKAILNDYAKDIPDKRREEIVLKVPVEDDISSQKMSNTLSPLTSTPQASQAQVIAPTVIEIPVIQSMSPQFNSIRASFAGMFVKVRRAIKKTPPPLDELKHFLMNYNSDLIPQLDSIENLSSVLRLIEEECTLIDVAILEAVVEVYDIKEAERYIKEYKTALKGFCESVSAQLCLKETFETVNSHPSLRCETATYVFDWEPEERRLRDITDILSKASGRLVKIKYIDTGRSVIVTCTFPHSLTGFVIATAVENLEILKVNGLMELTIGYYTIWKKGEDKTSAVMQQSTEKDDYLKSDLLLHGVKTLSSQEEEEQLTKTIEKEIQQQKPSSADTSTDSLLQSYKAMNTKMLNQIEQLQLALKVSAEQLTQSSEDIEILQQEKIALSLKLLDKENENQQLAKELQLQSSQETEQLTKRKSLDISNTQQLLERSTCTVNCEHSVTRKNNKTTILICAKCPIKINIETLHKTFAALVGEIREQLRIITNREQGKLIAIASFIEEFVRGSVLTKATDFDKLFDEIHPHYDFLNCELIERIVMEFLSEHQIKNDLDKYTQELENFLDSPTLLNLKAAIEEGLIRKQNSTDTTKVVIKLTGRWGRISINTFQAVIQYIFSREHLTHIHILLG